MITYKWLDSSRTIIETTFHPGWTWDDYRLIHGKHVLTLLDEATSPVYIVADLRHADVPEKSVTILPEIAAMPFWHHPKLSHVYLHGVTGFLHVIANVFVQVYGGVSVVKTKHDALNRIENRQRNITTPQNA